MRSLFVIGAALALLSGVLAWRWIGDPAETMERRNLDFIDLHWRGGNPPYMPMRGPPPPHIPQTPRGIWKKPPAPSPHLPTAFPLFSRFPALFAHFPLHLLHV